jgi:hypothetical protein
MVAQPLASRLSNRSVFGQLHIIEREALVGPLAQDTIVKLEGANLTT